MNKTISVLIPTFNREEFIYESINSILNQTYKELDIIIYDDGSIDDSVNIIKRLMEKDKRIRLIEGIENKGVGHARNELIKACNTKYAVWNDSDDISHPNRIEIQAQVKESGLIFTRWVWLYKLGKNQWVERIKNSDTLGFATVMFPVDKEILFDPSKILGGEDWHWLERMQEKYSTEEIDTILYYVRYHENRIGSWKRKTRFNKKFPKELLDKLSYKEILEYYKKHFGEENVE